MSKHEEGGRRRRRGDRTQNLSIVQGEKNLRKLLDIFIHGATRGLTWVQNLSSSDASSETSSVARRLVLCAATQQVTSSTATPERAPVAIDGMGRKNFYSLLTTIQLSDADLWAQHLREAVNWVVVLDSHRPPLFYFLHKRRNCSTWSPLISSSVDRLAFDSSWARVGRRNRCSSNYL